MLCRPMVSLQSLLYLQEEEKGREVARPLLEGSNLHFASDLQKGAFGAQNVQPLSLFLFPEYSFRSLVDFPAPLSPPYVNEDILIFGQPSAIHPSLKYFLIISLHLMSTYQSCLTKEIADQTIYKCNVYSLDNIWCPHSMFSYFPNSPTNVCMFSNRLENRVYARICLVPEQMENVHIQASLSDGPAKVWLLKGGTVPLAPAHILCLCGIAMSEEPLKELPVLLKTKTGRN